MGYTAPTSFIWHSSVFTAVNDIEDFDIVLFTTMGGSDAVMAAGVLAINEIMHPSALDEKTLSICRLLATIGIGPWWYIGNKKLVIISEKPTVYKTDIGGAVHCEDGPAVVYKDGTEFYYNHGNLLLIRKGSK